MKVKGYTSYILYENNGFSIQTFKARESVELPNGTLKRQFSIKGYNIPLTDIDIEIEGEFDAKPYKGKNGIESYTFSVTDYEELKLVEEDSIKKYLKTLSGVGSTTAAQIYMKFGLETYNVLDNNIEKLKEIDGIGEKKFEIISKDYLSRGVAKELFTYLFKYNVQSKKIEKIYRRYGAEALEKIKENPYNFYLRNYFSLEAADKIASSENIDRLDNTRIEACVVECLKRNERQGDTYLDWHNLLNNVYKLLNVGNKSKEVRIEIGEKIRDAAKALNGKFITNEKYDDRPIFYRIDTSLAEHGIAEEIRRLKSSATKNNYAIEIKKAEDKLGIKLSDEQESAVEMAMNNGLSIVTGGPGTGKTSFQQVLLEVFKNTYPFDAITLASPTGRAARRMTESSGYPASTLHHILGLAATDEDEFINLNEETKISKGLIIVDEVSMLDTFLAHKLFEAVQGGSHLVLVGDVNQLPSVGCGAILKDLIESETVPVTYFTKVFRQAEGSIIASNAAKINQGDDNLETGSPFGFIHREEEVQIVNETKKYFQKSLEKYGIDQTCVLTPFRQKTLTGVNELNPLLRELYTEVDFSQKLEGVNIYVGDKVMFTKNVGNLSNGDIGYVKSIKKVDNVQYAKIDFGDNRIEELTKDDYQHLVLAYATTIHKSQGSEYKCCIIIVDPKHALMMKKNLLYTAVTRCKEKAIIIGSPEMATQAIKSGDEALSRSTMLKQYLTA